MILELKHIPHAKDSTHQFDAIFSYLRNIFSTKNLLNLTCYSATYRCFLYACTYLEKACLLHAPEFKYTLTYNATSSEDSAFEINITRTPTTNFPDFPEDMTRLSGMEVILTQHSKHHIKIGFQEKNKILSIYTNIDLSWDSLYRLKRLQYQIFKEYYTECDPALFDFIDALIEDDLLKAQTALNKILDNPELKKIQYSFLDNYFVSNKERLTAILEERIFKQRNKIERLQNELAQNITLLNDDLIQCNALNETQDNFNIEDLKNYLIKHPYIKSITAYDSEKLILKYKAPLLYYDDAMLEILLTKHKGIYKDVLTILKEHKYSIWTRCKIHYCPENFYIGADTGLSFKDNAIPHPHIDRFGCLGNHTDAIKEWQKTGDYIGCIEQITAAVLNLNVADTPVMNTFINTLKDRPDYPCFQNNETKEFVTLDQIRKELKDNEKTQTK